MDTAVKEKMVLLIDDEIQLVEGVKVRLQISGYSVLTAYDGHEGLEMARQHKPDLILLDLMMPKLNGYEVCSMLKQDTRLKDIPVIIFSAKSQEYDKQLAMECGADALWIPPGMRQEVRKMGIIPTVPQNTSGFPL